MGGTGEVLSPARGPPSSSGRAALCFLLALALTQAVAPTRLQDALRPLFGIVREAGAGQKIGVDTESQDLGRRGVLRSGHMGRGWRGAAGTSLTWRRKVMGLCPIACASPMLARMTSVKGFFTPWERRGAGRETVPYLTPQPLCREPVGLGPTRPPQCDLEGSEGPGPYLAQLLLQLQGSLHYGATHCVLHSPHTRIHAVQRQHLRPQSVPHRLALVTCA